MLGRLAKWLRILGYDTAYLNEAADPELARKARAENRVLLTRDHELAHRRGLRTVLIRSEKLADQVQQVQSAVGPAPDPPLSRCPVCNARLTPQSAEQVADDVPAYVLSTQNRFRRCLDCGRVYWPGTHIDLIRHFMDKTDMERAHPDSAW